MVANTPIKKRPGRKQIITPQRKQLILNFIHEFRRLRRKSPTYVEIAKGIDYADKTEGTVYTMVEGLIEEGWLEKVPPGARSLFPTRPETDVYCEITDPELQRVAKLQKGLKIMRRL